MENKVIIETKDLTKTYKRFVKKEGLRGSIQGLFKREYEEKKAVKGINLRIKEGEFVGLIGPNGAGKTTLIDYIINPKQCYQGVIRLQGEDIRENHTWIMNKIGFVSEENQFFNEMTIGQNEKILGHLFDNWDSELFCSMLTKMELTLGKTVGKLSRGEMMKFQLAFAIAHHPVLYLLDEVTAGMDPVFRIDFFKILQDVIATEEASVLMTSHIREEISRKMDYVGVMENGRMISFQEAGGIGGYENRA